MITSVGIFSFRRISGWNSTLQQNFDYIAVAGAHRLGWSEVEFLPANHTAPRYRIQIMR